MRLRPCRLTKATKNCSCYVRGFGWRKKSGRNWGHYMLEQKFLSKEDNYGFYNRLDINRHNLQSWNWDGSGKYCIMCDQVHILTTRSPQNYVRTVFLVFFLD